MKPKVILVSDKFTKEEVEKIIDEAYEAGWNDGYAAYHPLTYPSYYPWTVDTPSTDPYKITWNCEDVNNCLNMDDLMNTTIERCLSHLRD